MSLSPGDKLGRYEILERIGAGGMGEVFRARDTDLGRDVAIKTSAQRFSERFEREAKLISSLNHPNICTLYDVGPDYLVMEYIEGPALDERIKQGPIPVDEALEIARQIGLALEQAHGKQVVHRDLKPGNVKIRTDGVVKVLDFGLAKALVENRAASDETRTLGETQAGMILGTPAYMSPEQARGQKVDKRADIWSFGVVLYEMLTGQKLFRGETTVDTLSEVVNKEPDWQPIPAKVQPLLKRCLEKDARKRLRDISGMDLLLEQRETSLRPANARRFLWPAAAAIFAAGLVALATIHFRETPPQPELTRFEVSLPDGVTPTRGGWLSPDGRKIVFNAIGSDGVRRLWLRTLDSGAARPMQGTETNIDVPLFWSWDSRFVAFHQAGKLKKIDIAGAPPQTFVMCPTSS